MDHNKKPDEISEETNVQPEAEEYDPPRGAVTFVALMLAGYILYYLFIWFEVFVIRGA